MNVQLKKCKWCGNSLGRGVYDKGCMIKGCDKLWEGMSRCEIKRIRKNMKLCGMCVLIKVLGV